MFGIKGKRELRLLEELVARQQPLSAFGHIAHNFRSLRKSSTLVDAAVCLDTCVLIHLFKHKQVDTILDYFSTKHRGLLVVSAQSLQEFWNNHVFAIETVSSGIAKKFGDLEKEIKKVDPSWSNFSPELEDILARLKDEYGHLHEPKTRARLSDFAEQLADRAVLAEVPRSRFYQYAEQRKKLKTPPGFEDAGHGDFFIWLDFLYSIKASSGIAASSAIMVTDDTKKDWSKGSVPHPVLAAEMESYTGLGFETWTLEKLWLTIRKELDAGDNPLDETNPEGPNEAQ